MRLLSLDEVILEYLPDFSLLVLNNLAHID